MPRLKSEQHHWWPECVSEHWADHDGGVHWLLPDGELRRSKPNNFGKIGNGHLIKLGRLQDDTGWDTSFEPQFQRADDNFPRLLDWLNDLDRCNPPFDGPVRDRMLKLMVADDNFAMLIECLVSLCVRSPMHRERAVSLAEHYRGPLPEAERNVLIGMNMRNAQVDAVRSIGGRGKALVIYSPEREFIFGDGFFHNIYPPVQHLTNVKMLVPLTPWLAVLFARPSRYTTEPRLTTLMATVDEVDALNLAVQVYARNMIFYRSEPPAVTEHFSCGRHRQFADHRNSVDQLIEAIPGIPPRDTSLDGFFDRMRQERDAGAKREA